MPPRAPAAEACGAHGWPYRTVAPPTPVSLTDGEGTPTSYDTPEAFLAFAETPADLCIVEVGLGGRFDATNVFDAPAVSVITPVVSACAAPLMYGLFLAAYYDLKVRHEGGDLAARIAGTA